MTSGNSNINRIHLWCSSSQPNFPSASRTKIKHINNSIRCNLLNRILPWASSRHSRRSCSGKVYRSRINLFSKTSSWISHGSSNKCNLCSNMAKSKTGSRALQLSRRMSMGSLHPFKLVLVQTWIGIQSSRIVNHRSPSSSSQAFADLHHSLQLQQHIPRLMLDLQTNLHSSMKTNIEFKKNLKASYYQISNSR